MRAPRPGFVFLSDNVFPGWSADVNGAPVPILRSWITFRAVQVPAGASVVVFRYHPSWAWNAIFLSAATGLLLCAFYVKLRLITRVRQRTAAEALVMGMAFSMILFWTWWLVFVRRGA